MGKGVSLLHADRREFFRGAVKLVVLLLCFGWLGWLTASQWRNLTRSERYLAVPLISATRADYSAGRPTAAVAQVGLGVIQDLIRDSQPESADLPVRMATAAALLNAPIPGEVPSPHALPEKGSGADQPGSTGKASPTEHPGPSTDPGKTEKTGKPDNPGKRDASEKSNNSGKADKSGKAK